MRVLVVVASRHGSTLELAQAMGEALRAQGVEADVRRVEEVPADGTAGAVTSYDAVVLGSALYVHTWLEPATRFAVEHTEALRSRPVWLFSSGPVGDPAMHEGPAELAELIRLTGAREHRQFAGRLDEHDLDDAERAIVLELHASGGDYRDWAAVRGWAAGLARSLSAAAS